MSDNRPPRDDLVRATRPGFELRSSETGEAPTMFGHFATFNDWTEIDSAWEGRFMEQIAPGAFAKTIAENRSDIKVLFQHGMDFQIGDKPLGAITDLRETDQGAYYEVPLLNAPYVRDNILPGLEAGLYGASFRFKVMREEFLDKAKASRHNPDGLSERTIKEVRLFEFGPVTFPAYASATAGVRSLTDEFILDRFRTKPDRLRELIASVLGPAPSDDAGQPPTSPERRGDPPGPQIAAETTTKDPAGAGSLDSTPRRFRTREEFLEWISAT